MKIKIEVLNDYGTLLAAREAIGWESANEVFGKLERTFKKADENLAERERGNLVVEDEVDVMRAGAMCPKCGDEVLLSSLGGGMCGSCAN